MTRLVYVAGAGRSGSTLLDLLLGRHSAVTSVGEMHRLAAYARTDQLCTCGQPVVGCAFWLSVADRFAGRGDEHPVTTLRSHDPMFRPDAISPVANAAERALLVASPRLSQAALPWLAAPHAEALRNSLAWYEAIRVATGCPVVLDSTKDPRRLAILNIGDPEGIKAIHLVRDGRAVAASAMRRTGASMMSAATAWSFEQRRASLVLRNVSQKQRIQYEELCLDTRSVLERVSLFLQLQFEPGTLEFDKRQSHNIGGNPMRMRKNETRVMLDERWKTELSAGDLAVFNRVAGRMNRAFGYS